MSLFRDINFMQGGVLDRVSGNAPTAVTTTHKQTERGLALETSTNLLTYGASLLPTTTPFTVVIWARLRYVSKSTDVNYIISNVTGGTKGLSLHSSGAPLINLGTNVTRNFTYTPDKKFHCFVFTLTTGIADSAFYVDGVNKPANVTVSSGTPDARSGYVYLGGATTSTGGNMLSRVRVYDHVLSDAEITKEQIEFEESKPYFNNPFKNITLPNGSNLVIREDFSGYGVNTPVTSQWIKGTGSFLTQQMFADSGIKKKGSFYLKCTSSGTIAIPCNVAYGQWGIQHLKGADANVSDYILGITTGNATASNQNGYVVRHGSDEKLYLYKSVNGTLTALITSSGTYPINTWHDVKLTRTSGNLFTLYVLVNGVYTSIGTATDSTFTSLKWFVVDNDTNDYFANLKIWNQPQ